MDRVLPCADGMVLPVDRMVPRGDGNVLPVDGIAAPVGRSGRRLARTSRA